MRTYLNILSNGLRYRRNGLFAFFFMFLNNFFGVISLILIIPFLQILFNEAASPKPEQPFGFSNMRDWAYYWLGQKISFADADGKFSYLLMACGFLMVALFLKNLFRYLASYNIGPLEQGVVNELRKKLFNHLSRLSLEFYTGKRKGEIINVLVSDVQVVQESVIGTLQNTMNDPLTMTFFLSAMFLLSWKLTLFTLVVLPISGLAISIISKGLKKKARQGQESLGRLVSVIDEFVGGIRIVKAFGAELFEINKYKKQNDNYQRQMVSLKRRSDLASPLTELLSILVVISIILYGGNLILQESGDLKASMFITFVGLFSQVLSPIKTLSSAISRIQRGIVSFDRITDFLATEEKVKEAENAKGLKGFSDCIRFDNVGFSYGEEAVLKNISFSLKKGQVLALVGPSGAGKSTLADLLPRFYDPGKGKILVDGIDTREVKVADLRNLFGIVSQEGILFNDSVANNIAYGETQPDMTRVVEAAKAAHADEFILNLPSGYSTLLGERGTRLSGGQRQRISIARALYRNPEILILDEATSSLDTESEHLVKSALDKLMTGRTSIVIAHRLSTITHADQILVIEDGMIAESGIHAELMHKSGPYSRLFQKQFED